MGITTGTPETKEERKDSLLKLNIYDFVLEQKTPMTSQEIITGMKVNTGLNRILNSLNITKDQTQTYMITIKEMVGHFGDGDYTEQRKFAKNDKGLYFIEATKRNFNDIMPKYNI